MLIMFFMDYVDTFLDAPILRQESVYRFIKRFEYSNCVADALQSGHLQSLRTDINWETVELDFCQKAGAISREGIATTRHSTPLNV